jgi:4-amino-4-deoxy-L-arabinose transferase-like glycosyltransferase
VIALAVISYLLFRPRSVGSQTFLGKIRELKPVTGSLITILVAAIWFLPVTLVHGFRFWDDFFFQHHLMRYTSSRFHRDEGLFFYLPVLLVGLYPWTMAPLLGFRQRLTEKERILIRFALCWLISAVLFFSFSQSKLPGYVLPAAPAFSILAGLALGDCFERNRWKALVILFAIFNAVMAGAIITGAAKFSAPYQPLILMTSIIVAVCAASFFLLRLKKLAAAAAVYSMIAAAGIVIGVHMIAPAMNWYESRSLAYAARCYLINNKKLVVYNIYDFTLVYYSNAHVDLDERGYFINLSNYQELYRYLLDNRTALVVAGNEELHWMQRADFLRVLSITRGKERSIVYVMLRRRPS